MEKSHCFCRDCHTCSNDTVFGKVIREKGTCSKKEAGTIIHSINPSDLDGDFFTVQVILGTGYQGIGLIAVLPLIFLKKTHYYVKIPNIQSFMR